MTGSEFHAPNSFVIYINGNLLGLTQTPLDFVNKFRSIRRAGHISEFVSVHINTFQKAVHIGSDGGRICRPMIIVSNGQPRVTSEHMAAMRRKEMTFDDFLAQGLVEYLDVNEENDALIAMYERDVSPLSTHLEIEPFTILGAVAGLIPYPHHNQSPRNTYQCAMGKQAIGAIGFNQLNRIDTLLYLMVYPQTPMVRTKAIELTGYDKLPAGQNAMVAVMSYSGYDIEDALILNRASVDRGFGRCQVFRKANSIIKRYPNGTYVALLNRLTFVLPKETECADPPQCRYDRLADPPKDPYDSSKPMARYESLDKDGLAYVGARVLNGDIYINKQSPKNANDSAPGAATATTAWSNVPSTYRSPLEGFIDKVLITDTDSDQFLVKVLMRQTRRPELGDKFSSRHGQKGVCGLIVPQEDMPFTDQGINPDIIMNPHGFPSRMTVGKMLELLSGKAGIIKSKFEYGTAFGGSKAEEMSRALIEAGYNYGGKDYLTSGITGEPLESYVFFGPICELFGMARNERIGPDPFCGSFSLPKAQTHGCRQNAFSITVRRRKGHPHLKVAN